MLLTQRATVMTPGVDGRYTVTARANLGCRLWHLNTAPAGGGQGRAELAAIRNMHWEAGYEMPAECRVVVDGVTWRPDPDTFARIRGPGGGTVYRHCDLARVEGD